MDGPSRKSGVRAALEYTGIQRVGCRRDLVFRRETGAYSLPLLPHSSPTMHTTVTKHAPSASHTLTVSSNLADEPMKSTELPRKVVVYGAKWPGDEDHQRAVRFFKKYVKPVLVAAAIDYDVVAARHSGDLAERVASTVIRDRRLAMGSTSPTRSCPHSLTSSRRHKTFHASCNHPSTAPHSSLFPCLNYVGFRFIPHMIWGFFNERQKTKIGCEAAYSLVINKTREFQGPSSMLDPNQDVQPDEGREADGGDLDFGLSSESVLAPHSPVSNIASSRKSYYKTLPERLAATRQLARGEREPTKEEQKNPPSSEVELRAERLNKELRWRGEEEAWRIVGQAVAPAGMRDSEEYWSYLITKEQIRGRRLISEVKDGRLSYSD
ncbi:inner membrane protein import complex subunit Tim54-domain-containing protein [Lanmaoa asiatica]|nr:inner membrane protein import complex subunit Tim54-domain-containing protein [Lanmaoa asiatica]